MNCYSGMRAGYGFSHLTIQRTTSFFPDKSGYLRHLALTTPQSGIIS